MTEGPDIADPADAQQKSEQQFLDAVQQSQRAIVEAVGAWAKSVESMQTAYPPVPERPRLPDPLAVVEHTFDFAEKMLAAQREFARSLLSAAAPAFPKQESEAGMTDKG
jgi:hypothetical protein